VLLWWGSGARFLEAPRTQEKRGLDEDATDMLWEGVQVEKSAQIGTVPIVLENASMNILGTKLPFIGFKN
jgi:hypothetical protein